MIYRSNMKNSQKNFYNQCSFYEIDKNNFGLKFLDGIEARELFEALKVAKKLLL